ncbi:Tricetin 3',4',5'-O-trimethyltransferase [Apostasia shenzhenica]|uniref:Tricetin 3',4',5'-O-trimethyltransferase n=1 Tax=Apostasia shenzhenica TaxID=1088818 RepID=A0A2I0B4R0_9ASPA|nr:Tricetin 3',4',5'-O-trimethyltransferase [Apostasia shenzhenica]
MKGHAIVFKKLLEKYEGFAGASGVVVDVGGGTGVALKLIRGRSPSRVEHIEGDMFESVPAGDTILMKMILHDWCDEDCLKILKNCRKALPETGKVVSVEPILPESPEASTEAHCVFPVDMLMLLESPSGKERTKKEFESLTIESGFTGFRPVCSFATVWVMEFTK